MRIAVYSGSFNPLHIGHQAIIRFLTEKAGFDLVYLVVTPQNPFKDAHSLPLGKTRFDAAVEAVARHPELKVVVKDTELHMTPPQYTIRTLDALKAEDASTKGYFLTTAWWSFPARAITAATQRPAL